MSNLLDGIKDYFNSFIKNNKDKSIDFELLDGVESSKDTEVILSAKDCRGIKVIDNNNAYYIFITKVRACQKDEIQDNLEEFLSRFLTSDLSELYAARNLIIDDMYGLEIFGRTDDDQEEALFYSLYLTDAKDGYFFIATADAEPEEAFHDLSGIARTFYRKPKPATIYEHKSTDAEIKTLCKIAGSFIPDIEREWEVLNITFEIEDGKLINQPQIVEVSEKGITTPDFNDVYNKDKKIDEIISPLFDVISPYDILGFTITNFADGRYNITYYPIEEGHDHDHDHDCSCGNHDHNHHHDHDCSCGNNHDHHNHDCACGGSHHHGSSNAYETDTLFHIASKVSKTFKSSWKKAMVLISFNTEYSEEDNNELEELSPYISITLTAFVSDGYMYEEVSLADIQDDNMEDMLSELQIYLPEDNENISVILFTFDNDDKNNVESSSITYETFTFDYFIDIKEEQEDPVYNHLSNIAKEGIQVFTDKGKISYIGFQAGFDLKTNNVFIVENGYFVSEDGVFTLTSFPNLFAKIKKDVSMIIEAYAKDYMEVFIFPNGKAGIFFKESDYYYLTEDSELDEVIDEAGLEKYKNAIFEAKRDEILIKPYAIEIASLMPIGKSKAGSIPDVPPLYQYPKTSDDVEMSFIAQINLEEINLEERHLLAPKGMLYFFYDIESGQGYVDYKADISSIAPYDQFVESTIYECASLFFSKGLSLPQPTHIKGFENMTEKEENAYINIHSTAGKIKMFGYADAIEDDIEKDLDKDTILLLQVPSIMECGMNWGDDGCIYFLINKNDLKDKDFSKVKIIMQSYSY